MRFIRLPARWGKRSETGLTGVVALRASQTLSAVGLAQGPVRQLSFVRVERHGSTGEPEIVQHGSGPVGRLPTWVAAGMFRQASLVLVLDSGQRQILVVDEPEVPPKERHDALRWPVAAALELPAESLMFDATALPPINESGGRKVMVAATQQATLAPVLELLARAGLQAHAVDVVDMAQRNAVLLHQRHTPQGQPEAHLAIGVSGRELLVGLVAGGELCVPRNMPLPEDYSPDRVDEALSDRIVLHVQRTVDLFERQITRFAITSSFVTAGEFSTATLAALTQVVPGELKHLLLSGVVTRPAELKAASAGNDADVLRLAAVAAWRSGSGAVDTAKPLAAAAA